VSLLPLSAPVETEGGEGGDTEALSPDLIEPLAREMAIQGDGFTEQSWGEAGKYSRAKWLHLAELAAAAFLGAGWTPPLPAAEPALLLRLSALVDVYGYDGRFLYAGLLQARADGGWSVFHHTDSRHIPAVPVEPKETK
jgi:hypothetical protein